MHLGSVLVNNQLDAQFFFRIYLFQFSTRFEHPSAHHQEINLLIWYLVCVTPCRWPSSVQVWMFHHGGRQPKTNVKPEAAVTVFEHLMMGSVSPETYWAIKKHWNNKFYYPVASGWFFLWVLYYDARIHEHQIYKMLINSYITYLLTPWSRVLLEKLTSKLCS